MDKQNRLPALRFAGFTDAWELRKLGEIGSTFSGLSGKTKEDFGHGEGKYVTYMNVFLNAIADPARTDSIEIDNRQNCVRYGDVFFTTSSETPDEIGMSCVWLENTEDTYLNSFCFGYRPRIEIDPYYMAYMLRSEAVRKKFTYLAQGISRYNISKIGAMEIEVPTPDLSEQRRLGLFFHKLDSLLTLHQRKYSALKNMKKSLLEKMFPQNGAVVPEIRFAGFTDAWELRRLGEVMNITSVKRIHQSEWQDSGIRFLRARDIVAASKGEEPNDYLYISREKYEECVALSGKVVIDDLLVTGVGTIGIPYLVCNNEPLYFKDGNIIWFQNSGKIHGNFLYYAFHGKTIKSFIQESAGIGTVGTYTIESGKKTPIFVPKTEEQELVGSFFKSLDALLTLHQRKLEMLKNLKKALLEKMFV